MKILPSFKNISRVGSLWSLAGFFTLVLAGQVAAQTFKTLYSFTATGPLTHPTNSDGTVPLAGLVLSDHTLYGTADEGGSSGGGTVFAVNTDGTGFANLHSFSAVRAGINLDGIAPYAGLILSGNTLYGTTSEAGSADAGTVFAIDTDGSGFTTLHSFSGSDGVWPHAGLVLSGNTLYGTTWVGGSSGEGTVFAINTDGSGFTTLYSFSPSDGVWPMGGLILSSNTLYGTTQGDEGHLGTEGTVFAINTDGTGFTTLYSFTALSGGLTGTGTKGTNSDGAFPRAALVLSGNTLYGTTSYGGSSGKGTVFAINTDGTGFTTLYSFTQLGPGSTNSDGAEPRAALVLSGNTLYGTAGTGGTGSGTVFALNTDGTGFTTLHSFSAKPGPSYTNSDGATPNGLILSGNTLYGTAQSGGSSNEGTVFSLTLPGPLLTLIASGPNVILTWPTNATGFVLQSASTLANGGDWQDSSLTLTIVGDQNVVPVDTSAPAGFFRLHKP
jgi:uncharacterized repeat protein (TIGR03803 family)